MTVIGVLGLIGSGKNTVAEELVENHNFQLLSFADSLKSAISAVFNWPKTLLDGNTAESRQWREQVDPWWSQRLNIPNLTPRMILQYWGTNLVRNHFHSDTWVASVEHKLVMASNPVVISDVRFPNEIAAIRSAGGKLIKVQRGALPPWYSAAVDDVHHGRIAGPTSIMRQTYPEIHLSEWAWVAEPVDYDIANDGSLAELKLAVNGVVANIFKNQELTRPKSNLNSF